MEGTAGVWSSVRFPAAPKAGFATMRRWSGLQAPHPNKQMFLAILSSSLLHGRMDLSLSPCPYAWPNIKAVKHQERETRACWGTPLPLGTFLFTFWQSLARSQPLTHRGKYTFFALLLWQLLRVWLTFPCNNVDKHISHSIQAVAFQPAHLGNLCFNIYRQCCTSWAMGWAGMCV